MTMPILNSSSNSSALAVSRGRLPSGKPEAGGILSRGKGAETPEKPAEFVDQLGSEISRAGALAQALMPAVAPMPTQSPALGTSPIQAPLKGSGDAQANLQVSPDFERTPENHAAAVSINASPAIAGLKPWGREWVFEGADKNPNLKPLISDAPQATRGDAKATTPAPMQPDQALELAQGAPNGVETVPFADEPTTKLERQSAMKPSQSPLTSGVEVTGLYQVDAAPKPFASAGRAMQGNLSGGEFMSTLAAVRGEQANRQSGSFSGGMQNGSEERGSGEPGARGLEKGPLRLVRGGDEAAAKFADAFGATASLQAGPLATGPTGAASRLVAPTVLTGVVTSGAGARDRLSSDSLTGLGMQISKNVSAGGMSEIHMRLKPEALGEIRVKVSAQGNQVGLTIEATDEKAKKVLEDSMSYLRESLATHRLTLANVELSVAQTSQGQGHAQSDANGQNPFSASQGAWDAAQGNANNASYRERSGSGAQSDGSDSGSNGRRTAEFTSRVAGAVGPTRPRAANLGRIDVTA